LPSLDIKDAINAVIGICTLAGIVGAIRIAVAKLEVGQMAAVAEFRKAQEEILRQLGALHKRLDDTNKRVSRNEITTARLEERVDIAWPGPNRSQRFRLPEAED
jgi:hypothetical protein